MNSEEGRRQLAKIKELHLLADRLGCTAAQLAIGTTQADDMMAINMYRAALCASLPDWMTEKIRLFFFQIINVFMVLKSQDWLNLLFHT